MPETIISDTSCFIVFSNIGELELLKKTYGKIVTTPEVESEYSNKLPGWVEIRSPEDKYKQKLLELQVDKGEASAIALAIETTGCTVILDDYKARKLAEELGLIITGTIGVIVKAKLSGIIPSVKPYLNKIRENTDFYLTNELLNKALEGAGE